MLNSMQTRSTTWILVTWLLGAVVFYTRKMLAANAEGVSRESGVEQSPDFRITRRSIYASNIALALSAVARKFFLLAASRARGSKRRRAEKSLADSEERLSLISSSTSLGFWEWDAATDAVWASKHVRGILGLDEDAQLTGTSMMATVHPADRPGILQAIQSSALRDDTMEMEVRVVSRGSEIRWVTTKARIYRDAKRKVLKVAGYVIDVSRRKRAEEELLLQRQQLMHLSRVAILGELSGALVHELQQPLTSILCNARAAQHMLATKDGDLDEVGAIVQSIVADDKRAGEVIQRMRALLTRGEIQSQRVEVGDLIRDVLTLARSTIVERKVQLVTRVDERIPAIQGDLVGLQQVLLNLLLNACESMSTNAPRDRRIEIVAALEPDRRAVCISVLDQGEGIDADQLERIFDPFFTTKKSGLGLGLAICRAIIVAHKGRLWATNRSGGGAAFHFTVPVVGRVESHDQSDSYSVCCR
jgi:PAS domain S-box-containing protein